MNNKPLAVAVSGGIDSIVLLDALVSGRTAELNSGLQFSTRLQIIVAHFDHGVRDDSGADAEFVEGVTEKYGLEFVSERVTLGKGASEEKARNMRYNFLRQVCKKYDAQLVTAHHQDDVVETIILNLIRGTDWHGLVSLNSDSIYRPLLYTSKISILEYAEKHHLQWREDSTNQDQSYLRNYIRLKLVPNLLQRDPDAIKKLLTMNNSTLKLKKEIATELQKYIKHNVYKNTLSRYQLIMLPFSVAYELMYSILTQLDPSWHPTTLQLKRALHFIKSAQPHKQLEVSGKLKVAVATDTITFIKQ